MTDFTGFPADCLAFFRELVANNNRDWFAANKERYRQSVVYPMSDLIAALAPRLEALAPMYVADPRPHGGSMFRIYRDVRFSRDPRPYKEQVACQLRHQAGRDAHAPGYYIHIAPNEVRFGGGIYLPPAHALNQVRRSIDARLNAWRALKTDPEFREHFPDGIRGDSLKRAPKGFSPDHPEITDLRRKTFFVMHRLSDPELITRPDFPDHIEETFARATPFMRFLTNAVELPF